MSKKAASLCIVAILALALSLTVPYSVANDTSTSQQGWFSSLVSAVKSVVKSVVNTVVSAVKSFFSGSSSSSGSSSAPSSPSTTSRSSSSGTSYSSSRSSASSSYSSGSRYSGGGGGSSGGGGGSSSSSSPSPAPNFLDSILNFLNPQPRAPTPEAPQLGERMDLQGSTDGPFNTNTGDTKPQTSALPILGVTALGAAALAISHRLAKGASESMYSTSDTLGILKSRLRGRDDWQSKMLYNNISTSQFGIDLAIGVGEGAHDMVTGFAELGDMILNPKRSEATFKYEFRKEQLMAASLYPVSPKLALAASVYYMDHAAFAGVTYALGAGLWEYYTKDAAEHPGRALGRAAFDIGTFALPVSKAGSAGKLSKVSKASKAGKAGKIRRFNIWENIFKSRRPEEVAKIESALAEEKSLMKQRVPDFIPETTKYDSTVKYRVRYGLPDPRILGEAVPTGKWIWRENRVKEIYYYWGPLSDLAAQWGDDARHVIVRHELFHKALLETEGAWKMLGEIPVEARTWLMTNTIKIKGKSVPADELVVDILAAASEPHRAPIASALSQSRFRVAPMMSQPIEPYQVTKTLISGLEEASVKHGIPHLQKTADSVAQTMQNYMKKGHPLPAIAIGTGLPAQSR